MEFRQSTFLLDKKMIKELKSFFKFSIVVFVVISAAAGYGIGHNIEDEFEILKFLLMLIGTALISSGSLGLNAVQEAHLDALMPRTKDRPMASGRFSKRFGLGLSLSNIIVGSLILFFFVKPLTCYVGLIVIFLYNVLYTMYWKKKWVFAAVPGAIPGALPATLGYSAANDNIFSSESIYLFLLMFLWQMPHFWTLAIKYRDDYAKGGFPVLPARLGKYRTIYHISFYVWAYVLLALMSPFFVHFHYFYYFMVIPFALIIVWQFFKFGKASSEKAWLPFFLWTNFSYLAFLVAPLFDKYTQIIFR